jgi:hypothetical protein
VTSYKLPIVSPKLPIFRSKIHYIHFSPLAYIATKDGYSDLAAYEVKCISLQSMPTMASPRPQLTSAKILGSL